MALRDIPTVTVDNTICNTSINVIEITDDKLEKILIKQSNKMKPTQDIVSAIALSLTLLSIVYGTDIKSFWGLSSDSWRGVFFSFFILSLGYLGFVTYKCFRPHEQVENIMKAVKNEKCNREGQHNTTAQK